MAPAQPLKRKHPSNSSGPSAGTTNQTGRARKRAKTQDARAIAVQTTDRAFSKGELDVDKFVKAREFEIRALERGMSRAKGALTTRAFQSVPRDLRRRTASHNVKRVPKKLRERAARESKMAEDNTPTVTARRRKPNSHMRIRLETAKRLQKLGAKAKAKRQDANGEKDTKLADETTAGINRREPRLKKNVLNAPPKANSKFRKRQVHKTWLPTHMWHGKRAHLTPPKEPLWRFAVPLTPTAKSYRPMHRASGARGAVAWDTSYMSTVGLEGPEASILGLLKALGVGQDEVDQNILGKAGRKWREGKRAWAGWIYERNGWPALAIAPATVVFCAKEQDAAAGKEDVAIRNAGGKAPKERRKAFIRIQPSAFLQLWDQLVKVSKVQKPPVDIQDLRFEIGSIEITGPGSTEALLGVLKPSKGHGTTAPVRESPEDVWLALNGLTNPSSLPRNALLAFGISDPRLRNPPQTVPAPASPRSVDDLLHILSDWTPDLTQSASEIFDRSSRLKACHLLPSQKAINRRKGQSLPGAYPEPLSTDPKIPIMLLAERTSGSGQGTWKLLLPWKCVLPVWYSLMYYPLSSGGNPKFGGLQEQRQIAFENDVPWFPGDFPGTKSGWEWELRERAKRKEEWDKKPKGKRVEWDSLDLGKGRKGEIGIGWACDWERLIRGRPRVEGDDSDLTLRLPDATTIVAEKPDPPNMAPQDAISPLNLAHLPSSLASQVLARKLAHLPSELQSLDFKTTLISVKLTLLARGTPIQCARIYRLPTRDPDLRGTWLSLNPPRQATNRPGLARTKQGKKPPVPRPNHPSKPLPPHLNRQYLAASLLAPTASLDPHPRSSGNETVPQAGDADYPAIPDERDLIGFVTTGNFNLSQGRGTGIGSLVLGQILEARELGNRGGREERLCVVREAGTAVGRLARWELVG
ncbi:MAG: hypothetical protein M1819_004161 [Sarea resinae]|nr:MAG: hypothetical protein M1819_004161 [Sarea resinae]